MNLEGKRIIVTGGATGIGRATALMASSNGAKIALFDVNDEDGAATVSDINENGGDARYWRVDVVDSIAVSGGVSAAEVWMGGIDVLIHMAGIFQGTLVEIDEFPEDMWDKVIEVNLRGSFLMAKSVSAVMKREKNGVIIFAASGAGVLGASSSFAYGASKGAVHGLTMTMEKHLVKYGIRVNDILPGAVETPLKVNQTREVYELSGDKRSYEKNLQALIAPEEIAKIVVFMASDDANMLRGSLTTA